MWVVVSVVIQFWSHFYILASVGFSKCTDQFLTAGQEKTNHHPSGHQPPSLGDQTIKFDTQMQPNRNFA